MSFHDDRTVGWVNPNTGVTFTRVRQFTCAMDNHEPPRRVSNGVLEEWRGPDGSFHCYRLVGWGDEPEAYRAVYLIDDGRTVVPLYVAGFSQEHGHITLHTFPVNFNEDGTPIMRADRAEQVDHSMWMRGPVRAYHLKIIRD